MEGALRPALRPSGLESKRRTCYYIAFRLSFPSAGSRSMHVPPASGAAPARTTPSGTTAIHDVHRDPSLQFRNVSQHAAAMPASDPRLSPTVPAQPLDSSTMNARERVATV